MRKYLYYLLVIVSVAYLTSCSSSKQLSKLPMVGNLSGTEYVEKVITSAPSWKSLSGKTSVELYLGRKGKTKVNASLRIYRDKAIQLSVTPVLGIEVARIELTPEGLLVVDRMNKRFVRASFAEVSQLLHVSLDFHILQSLFLNELFLPGRDVLGVGDVRAFKLTTDGSRVQLQPKKMRRIDYQFFTSAHNGSLEKTMIGIKGTGLSLDWNYSDFTMLEKHLFPRNTLIRLNGAPQMYALNLKMSRLSVHGKWNGLTRLSQKYKQISLAEILNVLLKV